LLSIGLALTLLSGCGSSSSGTAETTDAADAFQATRRCLSRSAKPPSPQPQPREGKRKELRLTLEGPPDVEDAGILLADQRGYFAAAGLDVDVLSPVVTRNVPGYVDEGADDIGILPQPQLPIEVEKGRPLVAIGSLVRRPLMAMMVLAGSGIADIADLEGKAIAINGLSFEEAFLRSILRRAGLMLEDVELKRVNYQLVPALINGRADAILGVSTNLEGVELEACGLKPLVIPLGRLGIPSYEELVVVVRRNRLSEKPRWIRAFMSALARGTAAAIKDPQAAADAIAISRVDLGVAEPQMPGIALAKVKATLPLLSRSGRLNEGRAADLVAWMRREQLIQSKPPVSEWLTNRFVESP
jgi:putative hydroxymethylpyrimidine transport system substrate-binding protein